MKLKFNPIYYPDPNWMFGYMKWGPNHYSLITLGMEFEFKWGQED